MLENALVWDYLIKNKIKLKKRNTFIGVQFWGGSRSCATVSGAGRSLCCPTTPARCEVFPHTSANEQKSCCPYFLSVHVDKGQKAGGNWPQKWFSCFSFLDHGQSLIADPKSAMFHLSLNRSINPHKIRLCLVARNTKNGSQNISILKCSGLSFLLYH